MKCLSPSCKKDAALFPVLVVRGVRGGDLINLRRVTIPVHICRRCASGLVASQFLFADVWETISAPAMAYGPVAPSRDHTDLAWKVAA